MCDPKLPNPLRVCSTPTSICFCHNRFDQLEQILRKTHVSLGQKACNRLVNMIVSCWFATKYLARSRERHQVKASRQGAGIAEFVNLTLLNGLSLDISSFSCILRSSGVGGVSSCPSPYRSIVLGLWKAILPAKTGSVTPGFLTSEGFSGKLLKNCGPGKYTDLPVRAVLPRQAISLSGEGQKIGSKAGFILPFPQAPQAVLTVGFFARLT